MPVLVAAIVAVVGQTVILFNDFGAGNDSQGRSNARMTAVVSSKLTSLAVLAADFQLLPLPDL
jgi:hypothetical protein